MDFSGAKRPHRWKQNRIILHFDYDCFYAQVVENAQPSLKSLPLGIRQKRILATCNYEARRRGVKKLQLVSDAKKICPDLVLADGENLSAFRDVSKRLYRLMRTFSWNDRVERLGLDEVFLDVTDIVAFNVHLVNTNALRDSFFCLSREDPEMGFAFDATTVSGCVAGTEHGEDKPTSTLYVRLVLASHLARHLRLRLEAEGYTSACGISTSKLLSKLVGSANKPRNQTTLLSMNEENILSFMDSHGLSRVPGVGGKITHSLETFFLGKRTENDTENAAITVGECRRHPDVSPRLLEKLLGNRPGSERGIGIKVWALLHGVDNTEVKAASNLPTQISIEDTYPGPKGGLHTCAEIEKELLKLATSLLRRMRVDLTEHDETMPALPCPTSSSRPVRWVARPKTLRLSTRPKTNQGDGKPYHWGRVCRSQPLPNYVFHRIDDGTIIRRLVTETLLPMFRTLNPESSEGWKIGMINICVANMTLTATEDTAGSGRDISRMFRSQDQVLREFSVYDKGDEPEAKAEVAERENGTGEKEVGALATADYQMGCDESPLYDSEAETEFWDDRDDTQACLRCGLCLPRFAMSAHQRYHDLGDH